MALFSDYRRITGLYSRLGSWGIRSTESFCPFCDEVTRFAPFGLRLRPGAMCMRCHGLERHRALLELMIERELSIQRGDRLLYFAPDRCLEDYFRTEGVECTTCDASADHVDLEVDMTRIPLPDKSFDRVMALHVLEHIRDDVRAMREVHRILEPGGVFIVMIPQDLRNPSTREEPLWNPLERALEYGQHDHVRLYGLDFSRRAAEAGFLVKIVADERHRSTMPHDEFVSRPWGHVVYALERRP